MESMMSCIFRLVFHESTKPVNGREEHIFGRIGYRRTKVDGIYLYQFYHKTIYWPNVSILKSQKTSFNLFAPEILVIKVLRFVRVGSGSSRNLEVTGNFKVFFIKKKFSIQWL